MAEREIYLLLVICVATTFAACPLYWSEYNGYCYMYVGTPSLNWDNAEGHCVGNGAHLVSIHSTDEDEYVKKLWRMSRDTQTFFLDEMKMQMAPVSVAPFLYIGLNDKDTEGVYVWSDGSPVDYLNWMPYDPRDDPELREREDGVFIWDRKNIGKWNDVNPRSKILVGPFVCKKAN